MESTYLAAKETIDYIKGTLQERQQILLERSQRCKSTKKKLRINQEIIKLLINEMQLTELAVKAGFTE